MAKIEHLDPDTLAGFVEHNLCRREKSEVYAHLSECAICREWVAMNAGSARPSWIGRHRISIGLCALAASIVLMTSIFFSNAQRGEMQMRQVTMQPTHYDGRLQSVSLQPISFTREPGHSHEGTKPQLWMHARLTRTVLFETTHAPAGQLVLESSRGERWVRIELNSGFTNQLFRDPGVVASGAASASASF